MMSGAGDIRMLEHLDSSCLSETLKKAFFNALLELVPYTYSIGLEGTVGVTIDGRQMLFLHFSDTMNKSSEDAVIKSTPQHAKRNPVCGKHSLGNELKIISMPGAAHKALANCANGGTKQSLLLNDVRQIQSACLSEEVLVQSAQSEYLAVEDAHSELAIEKSAAARRKGRPAKFPSDRVTVFRNAVSNHLPSVCPVTGEEEPDMSPRGAQKSHVGIEPGGLEVLDFSTHKKVELIKRNAPDFSMVVNESPKCSSFLMGSLDDEIENAPAKANASNQQDRTLLRQLLLSNTKTKKAKLSKRRLSGSDDDSNKKTCVETPLSFAENSKGGGSGLLPLESDACMAGGAQWTTPSTRSKASKRTPEMKNTDDLVAERRANPDSILCRLLTSGVKMYDTTEVEQLRQASSNKQEVTKDQDGGRNTATASQPGNTIIDLVANIKTEREPYLRPDEYVSNTLEDGPPCFQSSALHQASDSPVGQPSRGGFGPLRSLPDAVPPQLQTNGYVAEQCLTTVKEERDVVVQRTLHAAANARFPSDAQIKENLYHMRFTKPSDFGN